MRKKRKRLSSAKSVIKKAEPRQNYCLIFKHKHKITNGKQTQNAKNLSRVLSPDYATDTSER